MEHDPRQTVEMDPSTLLVHRCLAGDALAWQEFVATYRRLIYYCCYDFTKSHSDAQELSQDVFLKLFCHLASFDRQKSSLYNWIRNVTRNHLVDHFRRTQMHRVTESLDATQEGDEEGLCMADRLVDAGLTQEQTFAHHELKTRVYAALDDLSPRSRDVIVLRYLQEFDSEETAKILRVPKGTVRSRLSRGLSELAGLLAPMATTVHT